MNDRARFASALGALAAALPLYGREFTRELQEVYWYALADLEDDEFEAACGRCLRELKAFPTPSELLERAPRTRLDAEAQATQVFLAVIRMARHHPASGSHWREDDIAHRFGSAAVQAFRAAGGTIGLRAALDPDRERFIRKDFVSCYLRVATADPAATEAVPLDQVPDQLQLLVTSVSRRMGERPQLAGRALSPDEIAEKKARYREAAVLARPTTEGGGA